MADINSNVVNVSYTGNNIKNFSNKSHKVTLSDSQSPCRSFKPETFLFGLIKNNGVMICKPNDGATLGEIREYTGAKKGAISSTNPHIIEKAKISNPKIKFDDIKVDGEEHIKIHETDLPILDAGDGFGLTVNGNKVYTAQPGDTKSSIAQHSDVQGYPEYNLQPGTVFYVKKP